MKPKFLVLPVVLAITMSGIYLLPQSGTIARSAVKMELPEEVTVSGGARTWTFTPRPPSPDEVGALSKETEFSKASCTAPRPFEFNYRNERLRDNVDLSIVLSGTDINNSIHRLERCLQAQGHNITAQGDGTLAMPDGRNISVRRLVSTKKENIAGVGQKEDLRDFNFLTYYFFVGRDHICSSHLQRTMVDIKDRLVNGMDQRWAYIAVTTHYGNLPWLGKEVPIEEAEGKLKEFLATFAEEQVDWTKIVP